MLQGFFVHQLLAIRQKGIPAIQLKTTKFAALYSDYFASQKLPLHVETMKQTTQFFYDSQEGSPWTYC